MSAIAFPLKYTDIAPADPNDRTIRIVFPLKYARLVWDDEHARKWMGDNFAWAGRDDYLAWVADWKAELRQRIAYIRQLKAVRRDKARPDDERMGANNQRQQIRIECRNLLLLRAWGKQESAAQSAALRAAA